MKAKLKGTRDKWTPIVEGVPWDLQVRVETDRFRALSAGETVQISPDPLPNPRFMDVSGFNLSVVCGGVEIPRAEVPAFEMTFQIGCVTTLEWALISSCNAALAGKPARIVPLQSFQARLRPVADMNRTGLILLFSFRGTMFREVL